MSFLLLTSFTVSIDSFFCGFSLGAKAERKFYVVLTVALTVFLMCVIANYSATLLSDYLTDKTASLGGIILILVGVINIFKKDAVSIGSGSVFSQSLISGIAVGLDGAAANLSLAIMGINAFYVPVIIAIMHAVMLTLGIFATKISAKKLKKLSVIAPIVLIALGIYKLTGLFI